MRCLVILILFLPLQTRAETHGTTVVDSVVSVYDGDTFHANISSYPSIVGNDIGIRLYGIDTPEINTDDSALAALAQQARAHLVDRLQAATTIILRDVRRGKYFRIVAEVWCDSINVGQEMIEMGLAKEYYGGTRPKW